MFCCFRSSRGSDQKKTKSGRLGRLWRRWIRPITHFWRVTHRDAEVSPENKEKKGSLPKPPRFNYRTTDYIEQMVQYIPAAVQYRDHLSISIFLAVYQKYVTTWEVLDLIMKMYGSFQPDCVEDQQTKSAIFSFLSRWLEKFPENFCEAPDMAVVRRFMAYMRLNVPSAEVEAKATELLSVLEKEEARKLKLKKDCAPTPESPVPYASGIQESLALRPAAVAEPQGDLQAGEDTELVEKTFVEPFEPEVGPVQPPVSDQALPISADKQSPVGVAADVAADVSVAKPIFRSVVVQLGEPECICPLPEVDI